MPVKYNQISRGLAKQGCMIQEECTADYETVCHRQAAAEALSGRFLEKKD